MQNVKCKVQNCKPKLDFKLYLITDRKKTRLPLAEAVTLALKGGVKAIQLREKDLPVRDLLELAYELRDITQQFGAKLFINDRIDVAMAVNADGIHLGHTSMPPEAVRRIVGKDMHIGVSTHNIQEATIAETGGADFVTFGPVFFTSSKANGGEPVGLDGLKMARNSINMPIFGLGGVSSGNARQVLDCCGGVSLISGIFAANDIQKAAEDMTRALS